MSRRRKRGALPLSAVVAIIVVAVLLGVAIWLLRDRLPGTSPAGPQTTTNPSSSPAAVNPFYELYFTTPTYPDKPENRHGGIDERYVQFVDAATKTLDVADYDFDLENVAQAMARAKARGSPSGSARLRHRFGSWRSRSPTTGWGRRSSIAPGLASTWQASLRRPARRRGSASTAR
jgi:hypothetical protein